jgi:hypothetical protein
VRATRCAEVLVARIDRSWEFMLLTALTILNAIFSLYLGYEAAHRRTSDANPLPATRDPRAKRLYKPVRRSKLFGFQLRRIEQLDANRA